MRYRWTQVVPAAVASAPAAADFASNMLFGVYRCLPVEQKDLRSAHPRSTTMKRDYSEKTESRGKAAR